MCQVFKPQNVLQIYMFAAIVQVNSKLRAGDMEGARKASDKTLFYTNTAVLTGLGILIAISLLFIAILLVLIFMGIDVASRGFHF